MNEVVKWIITNSNINVYIKGKCYIVPKNNYLAENLMQALKSKDTAMIKKIVKMV